MMERIKRLAFSRTDFAFETTLASRSFAPWLKTLCTSGYRTFLSLPSPELALARVAERVRLGGHEVPGDIVRRRFAAGLRDFSTLYPEVVDTWQMFDNSDLARPRLIASGCTGKPLESWMRAPGRTFWRNNNDQGD